MFNSRLYKSPKNPNLSSSRLNTNVSQNLSPIKSQKYGHLDQDKKLIINQLLYLFTHYSSKISKYCYRELNEKYFIELISQVYEVKKQKKISKNSIEYKQFVSMYYSQGKKSTGAGIRFQEFLQMVPVISVYLCPQIEQRQQAVKSVIYLLLQIYQTKVAVLIQGNLVQVEEPINDQTKQMVLKLAQSFSTVYKIYFACEIAGKFNTTDPSQESFEFLLNMMKDFDLFPKLMSASTLYYIYMQTLKCQQNNLIHETEHVKGTIQQKGTLFTLSKMIQLLVSCSRVCFTKLKNVQNPENAHIYQKEIFKTLLQYMETIKSMKNSFKTMSVFKQNRFSFILLEEYDEVSKQSMTRTFVLKDKVVKQTKKQLQFFSLFDKIKM